MKTLKSIQKNQEQLNSLLMEKWGYKKLNEEVEKEFGDTGTIDRRPSDELKRQKKEKVYVNPLTGKEEARPKPGSEQFKADAEAHAMRQPLVSQQAAARKHAWQITKQHAAEERGELEEQEKFKPGEQDEKAKKSSEQKKKESPKDIRAKYAGKHVDPGEQDEKAKKPSEREKFDPGKQDEDDEKDTLEEEHNCRAVHSGMNHDQWAEKNR